MSVSWHHLGEKIKIHTDINSLRVIISLFATAYGIFYFQEFNEMAIDMRDDEDTKAELHQRLEVGFFMLA